MHVDALARSVLKNLKPRPGPDVRGRLDEAAHWLADMSIEGGEFDCAAVCAEMDKRGILPTDIVDFCIPRASVIVGESWHYNRVSFWQVSLSGARLYGLIKRLAVEWQFDGHSDRRKAVLLLVPASEDHLVGPAVLADQLRRLGCSVSLVTSNDPMVVIDRVDRGAFDLLLISCGALVALENVAYLVKQLRTGCGAVPPIVLGGAALDHGSGIQTRTDVDLVTNDIGLALELVNTSRMAVDLKVAE